MHQHEKDLLFRIKSVDDLLEQYDADYVTKAALLYWMSKNDCPYPSEEDMIRCIEWVTEQIAKDILKDILR